MISKNIRCSGCGHEGPREVTGTVCHESTSTDMFTVKGHDPYSGSLYFRCPRCRVIVAVNPTEALDSNTLNGHPNPLKSEVAGLARARCPLPVWGGLYSGLTLFFLVVKILY